MKKVDIDRKYAQNRHAIYSTEARGFHGGFVKLLSPPTKNFRGSYFVSVQRVDTVCQVGGEETGLIVARFNGGLSRTEVSAKYTHVYRVTLPQLKEVFAESEEEFIQKRIQNAEDAHTRNLAREAEQRAMRLEKDETARQVNEFLDFARTVIREATGTEILLEARTIHHGKLELVTRLDDLSVLGDALTKLAWATKPTADLK
jgi:hypothetical protein